MSREKLLEALQGLDRRETPNSAAAQLREVRDEIAVTLERGFTLRQVWSALCAGGLAVTYSAFKSAYYRMQDDAGRTQGVSWSVVTCPHCGKAVPQSAEGECGPAGGALGEQAAAPTGELASQSASTETDAAAPGSRPAPVSFADVFAERQDFTAGRRWK